jgi:hypothetical protein
MNSSPTQGQPLTLDEAEKIVEIHDAYLRLKKNSDFKLVFEEHLLKNEVIRLHSLLSHPEIEKVSSKEKVMFDLEAKSALKFDLQIIESIGASYKEQLEEFREAQLAEEQEALGD